MGASLPDNIFLASDLTSFLQVLYSPPHHHIRIWRIAIRTNPFLALEIKFEEIHP